MCLYLNFDTAYLFQPKARSIVARYYYLSNRIQLDTKTLDPKPNGPIYTAYKTIRNFISSAAEANIIDIFHNTKTAVRFKTKLYELGHPQPPTIIRTDNGTSFSI